MKKDNYKVKFNQEMPSASDIRKHQDFDGLMADYEHRNNAAPEPGRKPKTRKLFKRLALAAAAAIGLLIVAIGFNKGKKNNKALANNHTYAAYVNPPLKNTVPEEVFEAKVDAYQGGRILFKSGTVAVVPPRAFANRAGEVVAGEVEIKIKEYHDYIDFFLSGIPMEYDSLGVQYQLESAGMIEIYAEQDGERLDFMPEKSIDIELKSSVQVRPGDKEPNFNIYELDQEAQNWKYITRDKMEFIDEAPVVSGSNIESADNTIASLSTKLENLGNVIASELKAFEQTLPLPVQPRKPEKANTNNYTFDLKVDKLVIQNNTSVEEQKLQKEEAALRDLKQAYSKAIWEVLPGQAAWSPAIPNTQWDDYNIKTAGDGQYTVSFIKAGSKVDIQVKPVLVGKDYQEAVDKFNKKYADFTNEVAARRAKIDQKNAELEEIKNTRKLAYQDRIAALKALGHDQEASNQMVERQVLNRFNVTSFGIWNCDRPLPPFVSSLKGKFRDQHDLNYEGLTAFRVDKSRNTVARFVARDGIDVQFDNKSDNMMWFVTDENKIAVYRPQAFKKIKKKKGNFTFVMDLEEKEVNNEEDIREILSFE